MAFLKSMSSTPAMKLPMVYRKIHEICGAKGLEIVSNLVGRHITSLEMEGSSITLLKIDDEMIELWNEPVVTAGLRWKM